MGLAGALLLALWAAFDARWVTTGYRSQVVTLVAFQALMLARIGLRLTLLAAQTVLYRGRGGRARMASPPPVSGAGKRDRV